MAHVDFKKRSITAKVVYYGCGLCGKTASLEYINRQSKDAGELMAVSTEGDRTIFFDFLPSSSAGFGASPRSSSCMRCPVRSATT